MKLFPFLLLLFWQNGYSQTYSTVISDKEIIDFINLDIQRDSIKTRKTIQREIIILKKENFYYSDSADYSKKNNDLFFNDFIFKRQAYNNRVISNNLDSLFSRADIDFFLKQIEGIRPKSFWKKPFKNSWLVKEAEMVDDDYHYVKAVVHNYSLPVFSLDKKRAIIVKYFFCGFLCGGTAYYLYSKNEKNEWELIKTFNEYGE